MAESSFSKKGDEERMIELGERQLATDHFVEPGRRTPSAAFGSSNTQHSSSMASLANNPAASVAFYCASSILMTCVNKYIVNNPNFNLPFFMLSVQATVCILAISISKAAGFISYRDFNSDEARKWFPIALLLIGMIYTGAKALQFLSVPVYTIFKNLTIILIAYGEVLWFGGSVTGTTLFSFGLMVISSVIAAWADIQHALSSMGGESVGGEAAEAISTLNAGYLWMLMNCFCSAAFVLGMRKRIKLTNFKDFDTMFYNNLLSLPVLVVCSLFLENWSSANLALNFPEGQRAYYAAALLFTGLSSIFISYASAWCVRVTSSTTYSMVGALNKLPIAIAGLIFFNEVVTLGKVAAIFLGFVSGIVYAVAKVWQKEREQGVKSSGLGGILPMTSQTTMSASVQSMRDSLKS